MAGDTIAALATATGPAAIAIIRISGPATPAIGCCVTGRSLRPRHAHFCTFRDAAGAPIDQGLALYFPAPASYTGEHLLELQGHGGRVVSGLLLERVLAAGARCARAGEFSERAFLNGKLGLPQAEAVADLIRSGSEQAARAAARSLTGNFAGAVRELQTALKELRLQCEAAIDFSEEAPDPGGRAELETRLRELHGTAGELLEGSRQGRLLNEGLETVICGPPNAGKSTLFNALCGAEDAIVSPIPGTTRDLLHAELSLGGLRLRLTDSAGLHGAGDALEQEGMRRARAAARAADLVLYVLEEGAAPAPEESFTESAEDAALPPVVIVHNKIDRARRRPGWAEQAGRLHVHLSALTGAGLEQLVRAIQYSAGFREQAENVFLARTRHRLALKCARAALERNLHGGADLELVAEDLGEAARELGFILGEQTTEELLGEIFSRFCVGK